MHGKYNPSSCREVTIGALVPLSNLWPQLHEMYIILPLTGCE